MKYVTIYDTKNDRKVCDIHKLAWNLTKKGKPFSFLSGYIICSYMCDEKREYGFFFHMIDALKVWWRCERGKK